MSRLVLVADSTWVVNEVSAALAADDWEIETVTDPRSATSVVEESRPDAVITDLQVGSKGGMAVIRAIRQLPGPRPRLILLLDRSADVFLAGRAGADAHVMKPIKSFDLRRALAGDEEE